MFTNDLFQHLSAEKAKGVYLSIVGNAWGKRIIKVYQADMHTERLQDLYRCTFM